MQIVNPLLDDAVNAALPVLDNLWYSIEDGEWLTEEEQNVALRLNLMVQSILLRAKTGKAYWIHSPAKGKPELRHG